MEKFMKSLKQMTFGRLIIYVFLTLGAIVMFFPFYWMITGDLTRN